MTQLHLFGTHVSDLSPLSALTKLSHLNFSRTKIGDATPLTKMKSLEYISFRNVIFAINPEFWSLPHLESVDASGSIIEGIPNEVLENGNALPAVRAHLKDLGESPSRLNSVKLVILGNGRVGKTQLANRVSVPPIAFDQNSESTHGITVKSTTLKGETPDKETSLKIWDFGGQDIYHSTHSLFLRSRSIYLLAWSPKMEEASEHEYEGQVFRNFPLDYWLEYIYRFSKNTAPLIVVQTQCDSPEQVQALPATANASLSKFKLQQTLTHSAKTDEYKQELENAIRRAYSQFNPPYIGKGRLAVLTKLETMIEQLQEKQTKTKTQKSLTFSEFEKICDEAGGVSDRKQFLIFLHNAGIVFYDEALLPNQIILDQNWALEAIYSVFNRRNSLRAIQNAGGHFTRRDLADYIWNDAKYTRNEQDLFLNMMQSCGICFIYSIGPDTQEEDYVAPDLLPSDKPDFEKFGTWEENARSITNTLSFPFLSPAILRNLLSKIGTVAGQNATYWKNGIHVYDATLKSRAIIEQTMEGDREGTLTIRVQNGQSDILLNRLVELATETSDQFGLTFEQEKIQPVEKEDEAPLLAPNYAQAPPDRERWYVSYAWNDDKTPEGKDREEMVDKFCEEAKSKGILIVRDKDRLKYGDSIEGFMRSIAQGDKIFVVMSDKYLKSENCMFELYHIWKHANADFEAFKERILPFCLPDAKIWEIFDRPNYVKYWRERFEFLRSKMASHSLEDIPLKDHKEYDRTKEFSPFVKEILPQIADILMRRSFEELETYIAEEAARMESTTPG
ncbi:MAG: TIR domain-containing protein [Kordiimonadaceae bacterium]|nr:TIR domain-containing protein [Kordiimonadaceae bacterium]